MIPTAAAAGTTAFDLLTKYGPTILADVVTFAPVVEAWFTGSPEDKAASEAKLAQAKADADAALAALPEVLAENDAAAQALVAPTP